MGKLARKARTFEGGSGVPEYRDSRTLALLKLDQCDAKSCSGISICIFFAELFGVAGGSNEYLVPNALLSR